MSLDDELRTASAGRLSDAQRSALLDGLDRSRFLTDSGEVDAAKVREFVDAVAPAATTPPTGGARMGQGRQPSGGTGSTAAEDRYWSRHKRKQQSGT